MKFRKATVNEIDKLIYLRKKQLVDEGIEPNQEIDTELKEFFTNKMGDGSLIEWIVEDNDEMIATGAIIFLNSHLPTPTRVVNKRKFLILMYLPSQGDYVVFYRFCSQYTMYSHNCNEAQYT
ncbi:hypothetical protein [Priestia megaterium]|uniref:hypothetical protein n=1 Tax=Priestia megaterium TaxID=1404 RepID=UPI0020795725|nr:hypothetical protein [Priestia megaterium]USL45572.1 hypothetical protein LIS78_29105 [Priestia megaterium]